MNDAYYKFEIEIYLTKNFNAMKETKLTQLLSKLSGSKGVAVLICFVAFMFVGFVSAEAQTATIDAQTGLITLDDQQGIFQ